MAIVSKIEPRTEAFLEALDQLKKQGKSLSNVELAAIIGIRSKSTISEIKAKRQNIQPEAWEKFKQHFKIGDSEESVQDRGKSYSPELDEFITTRATVKILAQELAKLQSKVYNKPVEDCLEDMERSTTLLLRELYKEKEKA